MARFALILGALLAVGCGPDVHLAADRSTYAPGNTVDLMLSNNSAGTVFYAQTLHLERQDGSSWTDAYPGMADQFSYPTLNAGQAIPRQWVLAKDLPGGTYRVGELTGWADASTDKGFSVYCDPFAVTAP